MLDSLTTYLLCFQLLLSLVSTSSIDPTQNLTAYLLDKYSQTYTATITGPTFFKQVLNGTVEPERVAYFFEQDTIYGRGFTTLCGNTLTLLTADLTTPVTNLTLTAIDNLGETASGLSDEDNRLSTNRNELVPGSLSMPLCPSNGTLAYVEYMKLVSTQGDGFPAFVCSWTMGKAFIDVWTSIQANQQIKPNKIPQLQSMIDYWSDPSYVDSIDATADLVDQWFSTLNEDLGTAEDVFLQTLQRETLFWVSVDEWTG